MPVLKILHYPDPLLNRTADPVTVFDKFLTEKIQNMIATMKANGGIGLAAIQVNIPLQIFVLNTTGTPRHFINAQITHTEGTQTSNEGCLSIPGELFGDVSRAQKITLEYVTDNNEAHTESFEGLEAAAIQHEMEHLNGILYIDHLEKETREKLLQTYNAPPSPARKITKCFLALFGITAGLSLPVAGLGLGIHLVLQTLKKNFQGSKKERALGLVAGIVCSLWVGSLLPGIGLLAGVLVGLAARALTYYRDHLLHKTYHKFLAILNKPMKEKKLKKMPILSILRHLSQNCAATLSAKVGEQDITALPDRHVRTLLFNTLTQNNIFSASLEDANIAAQQKIILNNFTKELLAVPKYQTLVSL